MEKDLENKLDELLGRYFDLGFQEGLSDHKGGSDVSDEANKVLAEIKAMFNGLSQNNMDHRIRFYKEMQDDVKAPKSIPTEQKFKKLLPRTNDDLT